MSAAESPSTVERLLSYIDASPTPFHAVVETEELLEDAGFQRLQEGEAWKLEAGKAYHVNRGGSCIAAFIVGVDPVSTAGFRLVGAHVDSPNLRLKPLPAVEGKGYRQFGVEVYGGALLGTWTDRDLSLAGRLVLKGGETKLLRVDRTICRVPQLAIHLNRGVNEEGLKLNKQKHLPPVAGLTPKDGDPDWFENFLAAESGVAAEDIVAHDLMLHEVWPSVVSGLDDEFIHAPRLDNLASCHAAIEALINQKDQGSSATRGFVLYDHEEVGSTSAVGAQSGFVRDLLERIALCTGDDREGYLRAICKSLFVSADMAHALHPNYAEAHEDAHRPMMNAGPVIKVNANQRYATDAPTSAAFEELARDADVPIQKFVNRTDLACGSTIGPLTAAALGMPTVDVGNPMLSMHSIREMAGSKDHELMIKVLEQHYR